MANGLEENWRSYVELTKAKADSHGRVSQYWDTVHNVLSLTLIFLSAVTTVTALLPIHDYVTAGLAGVTTLFSAVAGFLAPSNKRQVDLCSSMP